MIHWLDNELVAQQVLHVLERAYKVREYLVLGRVWERVAEEYNRKLVPLIPRIGIHFIEGGQFEANVFRFPRQHQPQ